MQNHWRRSLLLVTTAALAACLSVVSAESPSWTLYHSWDGGVSYSRRGVVEWNGEEEELVITNDESAINHDQVKEMLDFGWYQIKIDTVGDDYVLATVPACTVRRANFKDEFTFTIPRVGNNEQQITSLTYNPLVSPLAPATCEELPELSSDKPVAFSSKIRAEIDVPGMTIKSVLPQVKPPAGLTWLSHPNARKGSASRAPGGDPSAPPGQEEQAQKPFFIRYWYVILPLVLANFLPDPQQQQQGAQGGQAQASGDSTSAPAAAVKASPKRRGKRN